MKKVYLAGPITGLSFNNSEGWRTEFKRKFVADGRLVGRVELFSPLRGKDYLHGVSEIGAQYEGLVLSCAKGVMGRDYWDVTTADALVIDFTGSQRVSIGTVMEIGWAYLRRIPVIAIMDKLHDHPMVNEAVTFPVKSLDEALHILTTMFAP